MRQVYILVIGLLLVGCAPLVAVTPDQAAIQVPTAVLQATEPPVSTATAMPDLPPTAAPTATAATLACWKNGGQISDHSLRSPLDKLPLEFKVYLPPCYQQQPERHYPVLYLIHGQSFRQDQWDRLGADETVDALVAAGEIAPFIIVMPRDRVWTQPQEDIFDELLVQELIPYIDQTYRTLPDRQHRAIGGLSRGAAWAVHIGLEHSELFSAIGGHSLPIFWISISKIPRWLDAIAREDLPRIYVDVGDHDRQEILESSRWFGELLTEKNIPHEWYMFAGYHEEAYWQAHVEQYIRFYAAEW